MNAVSIVFPHQLFKHNPCLSATRKIILVEEYLFFNQYKFHKRKIHLHRASMLFYYDWLQSEGYEVMYVNAYEANSDISTLIEYLYKNEKVQEIHFCEVSDNWLNKRISTVCGNLNIKQQEYVSELFLNTKEEIQQAFIGKKSYFQTEFYIQQRKKRKLLVDKGHKPLGGKWSFDAENRLKYPKDKTPPAVHFPTTNQYSLEAIEYVEKYYGDNPGELDTTWHYPINFDDSEKWLEEFINTRFTDFGAYEDALVANEHYLHHSVLTPMLNIGLITPQQILDKINQEEVINTIPINSLEGFTRQIIGWREFIRGVYFAAGTKERTMNYWNFQRKIPVSFYNGTTGIAPIDNVIKKVLATGYCHHIERLMVLGNFMLLCEFDPDEVYRWFMELFIDSYDWVMVPNVYGMSQFADGGLMATKPYISGSNYLMKMSNYQKGEWQQIWDGLFWRFMHVHRDFFLQNPRLGMLVKTFDKMSDEKKRLHLQNAERYLDRIS